MSASNLPSPSQQFMEAIVQAGEGDTKEEFKGKTQITYSVDVANNRINFSGYFPVRITISSAGIEIKAEDFLIVDED